MRILFVGTEEEYDAVARRREDGAPFSLFYSESIPETAEAAAFDAVVMPALRLLSHRGTLASSVLIASGAASVAAECFEAGCSDFIREPWPEDELHARVFARTTGNVRLGRETSITVEGDLIGPLSSVRVSNDGYRILSLLKANRGQAVPRSAIAAMVGKASSSGRGIDMRIARLRTALRVVGADEIAEKLRCRRGAYCLYL